MDINCSDIIKAGVGETEGALDQVFSDAEKHLKEGHTVVCFENIGKKLKSSQLLC